MNAYHKIKSFEVKGGFLDGVKIDFDDNLNCLIGGRGTGKTTVIEFVRYALGRMPDKQYSLDVYKAIDGLIRNNLGSGRLSVGIETMDGLSYKIEGSLDEDMLISDEGGNRTDISLNSGVLFNAEIYSQNEIENIAVDPFYQLKLIDKFIAKEISEIEKGIRNTERELDQNALEILRLRKETETLKEQLAELPTIAEKLKAFKIEEGEETKQLQKEIELKAIRDKEGHCLHEVSTFFNETSDELKSLNGALLLRLEECFENDLFKGENKDIFEKIRKESTERVTLASQKLKEALESMQGIKGALQENENELSIRHIKQEKRYRDLLEKHEKEKDKARERDHLLKKHTSLMVQQKKLDKTNSELADKVSQRNKLIERLSELRDERYAKRTEVAEMINSKLSPTIRVRIQQFGNTDKYSSILSESMKGSDLRFRRMVEKAVERIPPQDLSVAIQNSNVNYIAEHLDLEPERAEKFINHLKNSKSIYDIETVELYDKPIIELKDGHDYKDSSQLSTGQKCTTILPILLLESANPLLVDQPEDNLDNAFIYETVVKSLRAIKGKRQLIFVTHNPNIPVLGESEKVFVMRSSGREAEVQAHGSVEEVKKYIETILEGGEEAFRLRKEKYGY